MFVGNRVGIRFCSCNTKPTFRMFLFLIYTILKNINLFLACFNKSTNLHQINYKIIVSDKQNSVQLLKHNTIKRYQFFLTQKHRKG